MNSIFKNIKSIFKNILFSYWQYIILAVLICAIILFIIWVISSYYIFKWFKITLDAEYLYYNKYSENCIKILEKYGSYPIKRIYLVKKPVLNYMKLLINMITFYKFNRELEKIRKETKNDKFLPQHPYIIIEIELPNKIRKFIIIEKINRIILSESFNIYTKQSMYKIPIKKSYKLKKLLTKTKKRIGNKAFFNWGIYKNNSQEFIKELLISLKKYNKKTKKFVYQSEMTEMPTKFSEFNLYTVNCVRNITNIMEHIFIRICSKI